MSSSIMRFFPCQIQPHRKAPNQFIFASISKSLWNPSSTPVISFNLDQLLLSDRNYPVSLLICHSISVIHIIRYYKNHSTDTFNMCGNNHNKHWIITIISLWGTLRGFPMDFSPWIFRHSTDFWDNKIIG